MTNDIEKDEYHLMMNAFFLSRSVQEDEYQNFITASSTQEIIRRMKTYKKFEEKYGFFELKESPFFGEDKK